MDGFRLAGGCEGWELRIASRVQRLIELSGGAPRVVGVTVSEGWTAAPRADLLISKILKNEADGLACQASELPRDLPAGVVLGAILPGRDAPYRCISRGRPVLPLLPPGSRIAVWDESARAQVVALHRGFSVELARGRIDLAEGLRHGLWSAACLPVEVIDAGSFWGLKIEIIPPGEILPAAGQGALALLVEAKNAPARGLASRINDPLARRCVSAERTFVREAAGIPGSVAAVLGAVEQGMIDLNGLIADAEGRWLAHDGARAECGFGEIVAREVAEACRDLALRSRSEYVPFKRAAAF